MNPPMDVRRALARLARDCRGVSAVEFAVSLPFLIALFFGGFVAEQAITISRKVTITTRALADLTSQYTKMSLADMTTVMNASAQVLAPYSASPLAIRISQITTNVTGTAGTINWCAVNANASAYPANTTFTLPSGLTGMKSTTFIYAETSYPYTSPIGSNVGGSYTFSDRIFMLPRLSAQIAYSGS